ncbi:MAG: RBBP9/YdeN family alpha/beta hydrolase [Rhabdochlamydiaceae bacterium]
MKTVFIVHGTGASSGSNWFSWLKIELEKLGMEVIAPNFPAGKQQNLSNWLNALNQYTPKINSETIMVGHSLGPAFILSVLEKTNAEISASFLVAPFVERLGLPEFDALNSSFVDKSFDWGRIRANCKKFYVYASDNDPYVPLEKSELVARNLGTSAKIIPGAKHINSEAGYLKFEQLLDDIRELS